MGEELLDRVRCFDRVSTSFHFGPPRGCAAVPLPLPHFRLVLKGNTVTLVDPFLISFPLAFLFLFPSYHVKRLRVLMAFICARETRGAINPPILAPRPFGPTSFRFLSFFPLPIALLFSACGLTGFPALIGSGRRSCFRWDFTERSSDRVLRSLTSRTLSPCGGTG